MPEPGGRRPALLYRSLLLVLGVGVVAALLLLTAGLLSVTVWEGAGALQTAGVLVVIATPTVAVLVLAVVFALLGDWWCFLSALVVLMVLSLGLVRCLM